MRVDFWEREREEATTVNCGLKVHTSSYENKFDGTHYVVMIWKPKGQKPFVHISYSKPEYAEEKIRQEIESHERHIAFKTEQKKLTQPTEEQLAQVKVGSIFHWSWGYEQTNVDFYQVVALNGRNAIVREIRQETVEGSTYSHGMADTRMAVPGKFIGPEEKKRIMFSNGKPYLSKPYGWCSLWEGKPEYCSWYA